MAYKILLKAGIKKYKAVLMGILKTIGFTREKLRIYHFLFYLIPVLSGMVSGVILSIPLSGFVSKMTLTTTGVLIPIEMISPLLGGIILGVLGISRSCCK